VWTWTESTIPFGSLMNFEYTILGGFVRLFEFKIKRYKRDFARHMTFFIPVSKSELQETIVNGMLVFLLYMNGTKHYEHLNLHGPIIAPETLLTSRS